MSQSNHRRSSSSRTSSWKSLVSLIKRLRVQPKQRSTSFTKPIYTKNVSEIASTLRCPSTDDLTWQSSAETTTEPQTQRALVVARKGEYEVRDDFPMPEIGEGEIMIRSQYVGLNPIDWKSVAYNFCLPAFPWVCGREMSGTVEQVGKNVTYLAPGDRVWTSTYYRDVRAGCFQEYVVVPAHTVLPVTHGVSMESAACFGVPALTAGMTLWKWLDVPMPSASNYKTWTNDPEWLLIWGGSTVTGQFATQLATLSGLKVITVNSCSTKSLSEKLGATHVVVRDGKTDEELIDEIRSVTNGQVTRAIDLVSPATAALSLQAVSQEHAVQFAPLAFLSASQVVPDNVTVHTVEMKQFVLDPSTRCFADELNRTVSRDELILPSIHVIQGGLAAVPLGLEKLKSGNMGGKKLVAQIDR